MNVSSFTDGTILQRMNQNVSVANQAQIWETGQDGYPYATGDEAVLTFDVNPDCGEITLVDPEGQTLERLLRVEELYWLEKEHLL